MRFIWICLAVALALAQNEGHVLVLTDENFTQTIQNNPIVMVKFYMPWCGACIELAPEYERTAMLAKDNYKPYLFAEVNGKVGSETFKAEDIRSYPTLKVYVNGVGALHPWDRTSDAMLAFIKYHSNFSSTELHTVEEVKERQNQKGFRCFLAVSSTEVKEIYITVSKALLFKEYNFYHTSPELLKKIFPQVEPDSIFFLKDFDQKETLYNDKMDEQSFAEFLLIEKIPIVTPMSKDVIDQVFHEDGRRGIFLVRSRNDPQASIYETEFRKVAVALRSKAYVFVQVDPEEDWGKSVKDFLGIEKDTKLPVLELVEIAEEPLKYRHAGKLTEAEITRFVKDYERNALPRYYNSEPEPAENLGPVFRAVTNTFKREILDGKKDVIVNFHTTFDKDSLAFEKTFNFLADALRNNTQLKFVLIDVSKNDIPEHIIHKYPTVKFFPGINKNDVQVFEGNLTRTDIIDFIKEKSSYPINIPEEVKESEKQENEERIDDLLHADDL